MKKILILLMPIFIFAAAKGAKDYDIIPRIVNFIIFVGILYYLVAEPIKNAYKDRISSIAKKLDAAENRLRDSKIKKEEALKKVEETKVNVADLLDLTNKEIAILIAKIEKDTQNEIAYIEKSWEEQKELSEKKMAKEVVAEILDELFSDNNLKINQNKFVNLVLKKVS